MTELANHPICIYNQRKPELRHGLGSNDLRLGRFAHSESKRFSLDSHILHAYLDLSVSS